QHPHPLVVVRVHHDLAVVGRPRVRVRLLAPGLAAVVRAVDAALLGVLDQRVEDARVARVHGDADAADVALLGQAGGELLPGGAAVDALPQPAAGAAAVVAERRAPALVRRGVDDVRALRV